MDFGQRRYDELLAQALATGRSIAQAAIEAGVSERQARRRCKDQSFRIAVRELRSTAYESACGLLADSALRAVETLCGLLDSEHEGTRLAAAKALVDAAFKARESLDLEARISDLETLLERSETEVALHA